MTIMIDLIRGLLCIFLAGCLLSVVLVVVIVISWLIQDYQAEKRRHNGNKVDNKHKRE